MKTLKPQNYDFLWRVGNMDYFETSHLLGRGFLKGDLIFTYKDREWMVYIGKRERKYLSQFGYKFLQKQFLLFKRRVDAKCIEAQKIFQKIERKKLSAMSNIELREDFLKVIKFVQSLWQLYLFTEYFLYDKVQEKIQEDPNRNKHLLKRVQEMQGVKFKFREIINRTVFKGNIFEKYLKEIQKRTKRKGLHKLNYKEIADLLRGVKITIFNRKNWVLGKFNNWELITGKGALKIIYSLERVILKKAENKELKGQIANSGFYCGQVKFIPFDIKKNLVADIRKMKKGDVLVTGSTGPEMILACKKAGAIITEEGGICSHAAIVSRELGIPCIIGTKIATQVLKDGDLVEVDANKGVVKILKRAKKRVKKRRS